jgi:hypothetical protein
VFNLRIRLITTRNLLTTYFPQHNSKSIADFFQRKLIKRKEGMGRNKKGTRREKRGRYMSDAYEYGRSFRASGWKSSGALYWGLFFAGVFVWFMTLASGSKRASKE